MAYERIEEAAIRVGDKVFSVPRPGRHHDVFRVYREAHPGSPLRVLCDKGFVTTAGRFLSRAEAAVLADEAGQLRAKLHVTGQLTSEDLW
jgi:hypothetical protein